MQDFRINAINFMNHPLTLTNLMWIIPKHGMVSDLLVSFCPLRDPGRQRCAKSDHLDVDPSL